MDLKISVRVPAIAVEKIDQIAAKGKVDRSDIIREALSRWLESYDRLITLLEQWRIT